MQTLRKHIGFILLVSSVLLFASLIVASIATQADAAAGGGDGYDLDGGGGGWDGGGGGGGGGGTTACADGIDNDSNGVTDYPSDLGCTATTDTTESGYTPPKKCADGIDNDSNGFIDHPNDPGCSSSADDNESGYNTQCTDGIDNDSNGKTDYPNDYGCSSKTDTTETGYIPPATPSSGLQVYKTVNKRDYYVKVYPDEYTNGGVVEQTAAHSNWPASSLPGATISDTGLRICYLYDPTATITEWTLGGFDSPSNNTMAAWDKATSVWRVSSANSFGNQRYNYLTCKTWAPPHVSLSASDTDITAGESITLTWGSQYQRQGTFTTQNFSNTIFIPGHYETYSNYVCPGGGGGGDGGTEQTYLVFAPIRSAYAAAGCYTETTQVWVPDQTVTAINGSTVVAPTQTTTYRYTGTNVNGSWFEEVTVNVTQVAALSANPASISWGSSSTLSYTCPSGTTSASINNGVGALSPASGGTKAVSPTATTNYTLTCTTGSGSSQASATVTVTPQCGDTLDNDGDGQIDAADPHCGGTTTEVTERPECSDTRDNDNDGAVDLADSNCGGNPDNDNEAATPPPTVTLTASPTTIITGQSSYLTWTSSASADTCTSSDFATGGATNRSSPGVQVSPTATKTYNITCTDTTPNPDVYGYSSAQVTVTTAPTLSITAAPSFVRPGNSTTISWNGGTASSCSVIGPGLVATGVTGSQSVAVTNQSTYNLTCTKLGNSYQSSVIVKLLPTYTEE